jgi:hypothetical protein
MDIMFERVRLEYFRVPKLVLWQDETLPLAAAMDWKTVNWPVLLAKSLSVATAAAAFACQVISSASPHRSTGRGAFTSSASAANRRDPTFTASQATRTLFTIAGSSTIATGLLMLMGRPRPPQAAATLLPIPYGAMVRIEGSLW